MQSYGSRCVKPPILFGDVARPAPMTVRWWRHAQSLTERPVKGMLTGPVTILQWSFVRDDQPRSETCAQIALAIADEVADLEAAGAAIVQVDEAALREGLPLRRAEQDAYLRWAVDCFRLTTRGSAPGDPDPHAHVLLRIRRDDRADRTPGRRRAVDRSLALGDGTARRPARLPRAGRSRRLRHPLAARALAEEIERLLALAEARIPREQLWVNPDCGLKTRGWPETRAALANLVAVAQRRRAEVPVT